MRRVFLPVFTFLLIAIIPKNARLMAQDFFWRNPEQFSEGRGTFPHAASGGGLSVVAWQEAEPRLGGGRISIKLAVKRQGGEWTYRGTVAGPFYYVSQEPSIFNISVDSAGFIFITAAVTVRRSEIYISDDDGENFSRSFIETGAGEIIAPRIFPAGRNNYLLFTSRSVPNGISIYYARSSDAIHWTELKPFITEPGLLLNFLPESITIGSNIYVVFQSFLSTRDTTPMFQLFMKTSSDGGQNWSAARLITDFVNEDAPEVATYYLYDNERAQLSVQYGSPFIVWERRYANFSTNIFGAFLNMDGSIKDKAFRVNNDDVECQNPVAVNSQGNPAIFWFASYVSRNNRASANQIYAATKPVGDSAQWTNRRLTFGKDAVFARTLAAENGVFLFWQEDERIFYMGPDLTTDKPLLAGANFTNGRPVSSDTAKFIWKTNEDSSGILGFSYTWGRTPGAIPPETIMLGADVSSLSEDAGTDGSWYFSLRGVDNAGNWSEPAEIVFIRDMTPPGAVLIEPPPLDEDGYLLSNTFTLKWQRPDDDDVAGYKYNLEYLDGANRTAYGDFITETAASYEGRGAYIKGIAGISGAAERASFNNIDDGVWRFSLAPVDRVGNTGALSFIYFRSNKYIPHTFITYIDKQQDFQGDVTMKIVGRGFSRGGDITRIWLGREDGAPVDVNGNTQLELAGGEGLFTVLSDREILIPSIVNLPPGVYYVGLSHPQRGNYVSKPLLNIGLSQTIKYGDFSNIWRSSWTVNMPRRFTFDASFVIPCLIILLMIALAYYSIRGLAVTMNESALVRMEMTAVLNKTPMPVQNKRESAVAKLRGSGLRIKLVLFTTVIVAAVVVMVSTPVYILMGNTERETLLQGLWDRSAVLLEGTAGNARTFLPSLNVLELSYLPGQSSSIPEAAYITITGYGGMAGGTGDDEFGDYVWVTNDPNILSKIDTATLQPGVSRLNDSLSERLPSISHELNEKARREISEFAASINDLTQEALSLATRVDEASQRRIADIQATTRSLETRLSEELNSIGRDIGSEPAYSLQPGKDDARSFVLFKPVLFRQGASPVYFRGLVRLEINIETIENQIAERQHSLIRIIILVALVAIFLGFIGAFVLATLIIMPLRRLVTHIEFIRDTEDKRKLEGQDIRIDTNDEIAVLGDTINDMAHGLIKAAQASADLSIGKEIQKKFIPLDLDANQNKLTSGYVDMGNIEFFGYYEGAKGVSGDYFDYQSLDGRYYAIIKCDVAGKGIPAALIMIQVATMFINHFKTWKADEAGMRIERLVYQINEFIETLGFQGRFAAFSLALLDSITGEVRFCNAGDNLIHWYDASRHRMDALALPETPATGVLPNELVELKGGYQIQTVKFSKGDIILLYTDGIEEAKRLFRNADFEVVECAEGGAPRDTPHDTHVVGQNGEEIGAARQQEIANAAMNKKSYRLYKYHNPEGEQTLDFDYSTCKGTTEDLIMAMVSAEKVFRMYKPAAGLALSHGAVPRVLVDQKVDSFLKEHFLQYERYCSRAVPAETPGGLYYTGVSEDEQYDDLTILGVKLK